MARFVSRHAFDYLAEMDSEEILRKLTPDHTALREVPVRGVMVTSLIALLRAPEDPVTGSAHTGLGPYCGEKLGKREFIVMTGELLA